MQPLERGIVHYHDATPQAPTDEEATETKPDRNYQELARMFRQEFLVYSGSYTTREAVNHAVNHVERNTTSQPLSQEDWYRIITIEKNRISLLDFDDTFSNLLSFVEDTSKNCQNTAQITTH